MPSNIIIIDYNAGNVQSVRFALKRLGVAAQLSADPTVIQNADKVIFPGVGEASTTMDYLKRKGLDEVIKNLRQPVLGICLGMQLLCEHSAENDTPCLAVIPQKVKRFVGNTNFKVPHMGWNQIYNLQGAIFDQGQARQYTYFVHGYYVEEGAYTTALTDYIHPFSAAIQKDNFHATQFHPEKSGSIGEQILTNFINL
ncbi:MAG: glutamine amidotransferase [Saprospiraceae bacterium]|jgi:glutamine amidotransferase